MSNHYTHLKWEMTVRFKNTAVMIPVVLLHRATSAVAKPQNLIPLFVNLGLEFACISNS